MEYRKDYIELGLTREDLVEMYRTMNLIRNFELTAVDYFKKGIVIGNMHMYVGEEATATGICRALTREDYIASTHRCDGHLIAKGADINAMMAELMGKQEGNCGGRAGKMHQAAPEVGFMSANGIVGSSQTLGTGYALYCSMYAPDRISVAFFGDGGGNQGGLSESMNLAAVWKLPVIFVCENNHYAISTNVNTSTALGSFYQRAAGYGIPGVRVNGNDVPAPARDRPSSNVIPTVCAATTRATSRPTARRRKSRPCGTPTTASPACTSCSPSRRAGVRKRIRLCSAPWKSRSTPLLNLESKARPCRYLTWKRTCLRNKEARA